MVRFVPNKNRKWIITKTIRLALFMMKKSIYNNEVLYVLDVLSA